MYLFDASISDFLASNLAYLALLTVSNLAYIREAYSNVLKHHLGTLIEIYLYIKKMKHNSE